MCLSHSTRHLLLRSSENLVLCNSGQAGSSLLFYPIIPVLRRHPLLFVLNTWNLHFRFPLPSGFLLAANLLLFLLGLSSFCCCDKSPEINKHLNRRKGCQGGLISHQCSCFRLHASNPGTRPHPLSSPKFRDPWELRQTSARCSRMLRVAYITCKVTNFFAATPVQIPVWQDSCCPTPA